MASSAFCRRPSASYSARGHSVVGLGVHDRDVGVGHRLAHGTGRRARDRHDDHRVLARAVALDHQDAEAFRERGDVGCRRLRREHVLQAVVAVVLGGRCREDVGERSPDGAEVRGAVVADVGEEARRREALPQDERRAGGQRREHAGVERVAVEQRHRAVEDIVGREGRPNSAAVRASLRHLHRLGCPGRPRREDEEHQRRRVGFRRYFQRRRAGLVRAIVPPLGERSPKQTW